LQKEIKLNNDVMNKILIIEDDRSLREQMAQGSGLRASKPSKQPTGSRAAGRDSTFRIMLPLGHDLKSDSVSLVSPNNTLKTLK
jgi:hypothetical protein